MILAILDRALDPARRVLAHAMGKGYTIVERQANGRYIWDLTYNGVRCFGAVFNAEAAERAANMALRALKEGESEQ